MSIFLSSVLESVSRWRYLHYVGTEIEIPDRRTFEQVFYVYVKSERLRDILRIILQDVQGLSLREDNITVYICSI